MDGGADYSVGYSRSAVDRGGVTVYPIGLIFRQRERRDGDIGDVGDFVVLLFEHFLDRRVRDVQRTLEKLVHAHPHLFVDGDHVQNVLRLREHFG